MGSGRVRVLCIPDSNPTRIHIIFIKKKFKTLVVYILSFPFRFHFSEQPNPHLSAAPPPSLSLSSSHRRPHSLDLRHSFHCHGLTQLHGLTASFRLTLPSRRHSTSPPLTSLTLTLVFSQPPLTQSRHFHSLTNPPFTLITWWLLF